MADGLLPAHSPRRPAEEARQPKDLEQIRKGRLLPLLGQARAVSDENHCISWDTAAVNKPLDRTKKDLMTAKGLDREEGIRDAVLFGLISKQDFYVVNSRPAPAPGPHMPDKFIPDLKKGGLRTWRVALAPALQPQRGAAMPAQWQQASLGSPQEAAWHVAASCQLETGAAHP